VFEGDFESIVNRDCNLKHSIKLFYYCNFHIIFIEFMFENYQTIIRIDYKLIILQLFKLSRLY
jgi:hypothetical protein